MTDLMQQITAKEEEDDFELPSYNEPGRILFKFIPAIFDDDDAEIEPIDHDGCAFWLHEGGFMDYTIRDMVNLELEGHYVLEGVRGHAWQDYFGEWDEDWSFEFCRRATDEEIRTEALV